MEAASADATMELMLPVMLTAAAADWMATPTAGRMDWGMYSDTAALTAAESSAGSVLWKWVSHEQLCSEINAGHEHLW